LGEAVTAAILIQGDPYSEASESLALAILRWPFPAELMRVWPISTRVNKPENDDPSIVEPIELSAA
jgi:putative SOS response-associated peptidase YedK